MYEYRNLRLWVICTIKFPARLSIFSTIVIFIKVIKDVVIKWNSEYKNKERVLKDNKLINLGFVLK